MKELIKEELVDILEDYGLDVDKNGIKASNIDQFLTADLDAAQDELDPLYDIICQEVQDRRPDLHCTKDGTFIEIYLDEKLLIKFDIDDVDIDGGEVNMEISSQLGNSSIFIDESGAVDLGNVIERVEQAEEISGLRW